MKDEKDYIKLNKTDAIVMTSDGDLIMQMEYISKSGSRKYDDIQNLRLKRKKLVMGLDGFDEHSLEEANNIIDYEINQREETIFEKLKNFIK